MLYNKARPGLVYDNREHRHSAINVLQPKLMLLTLLQSLNVMIIKSNQVNRQLPFSQSRQYSSSYSAITVATILQAHR